MRVRLRPRAYEVEICFAGASSMHLVYNLILTFFQRSRRPHMCQLRMFHRIYSLAWADRLVLRCPGQCGLQPM